MSTVSKNLCYIEAKNNPNYCVLEVYTDLDQRFYQHWGNCVRQAFSIS
jgi:hypothetical protein